MTFKRRYSIRLSVVGGLLALTAITAAHFDTLNFIDKESTQALFDFVTDGLVKRDSADSQRTLRSVARQEYQRGDVFAEAFGVSGILLSSSQSVFSCVQWATLLAPFFAPVLVSLARTSYT